MSVTGKKISGLDPGSLPLTGSEIIPVVQGGVNRKVTAQDISNLGPSDILGAIAFDAAAPTPGKSGRYFFTTGGSCTWLTGGAATVAVGDEVVVVFTAPSTYTYTKVGRPDIEQTRSQSTSKVPSSKLVDDELNRAANTGFSAYSKLNDKNKSLLYQSIWLKGILDTNGIYTEYPLSDYRVSVFIPVNEGDEIYYSLQASGTTLKIAAYDYDKVFISGSSINSVGTWSIETGRITIPSGVYFIRVENESVANPSPILDFSFTNSIIDDASNYFILKNSAKADTDNWFNPAWIIKNNVVDNSGVLAAVSGWDMIRIDVSNWVGETTLRFGNIVFSRGMYYAFYDNSGVKLTYGDIVSNSPNPVFFTVNIPSGAKYFYADIKAPADSVDIYSECIITKGSNTLNEYKPYDLKLDEIEGIKVFRDFSDLNKLTADLPVSDGAGVATGYAYIDSVTGALKVKL